MKICPVCNIEFKEKRSNQVFCGYVCRTFFNNKKAKQKILETKELDDVLKKNRRICKDLIENNHNKPVTVSKDYLLGCGLIFTVFNRSIKYKENHVQCIYEFFLLENNDLTYTIGKIKNE